MINGQLKILKDKEMLVLLAVCLNNLISIKSVFNHLKFYPNPL